jgi:hypothetical protein
MDMVPAFTDVSERGGEMQIGIGAGIDDKRSRGAGTYAGACSGMQLYKRSQLRRRADGKLSQAEAQWKNSAR